jgi:integrase/recombinase XerD
MKKTSLEAQVERIFRHARQGSIGTRREYRKCMLRFVKWLEAKYNMQNLRNLSNKHLAAYVQDILSEGRKPAYAMKNLAAIRYYHDQVSNPRYQLERDNAILGVPKRVPPGDRAWTGEEYEMLCGIAVDLGEGWIADVLTLQYELGLRIHEVIRLDTVSVERVLRYECLWVKGKGGKERVTIPLSLAAKQALLNARARVRRGAKLFVPADLKSDQVIKKVQDFIMDHRPLRTGEQLTSHGLRYSYAQQRMDALLDDGIRQQESEQQVAREMGHERKRVTRGYLSR